MGEWDLRMGLVVVYGDKYVKETETDTHAHTHTHTQRERERERGIRVYARCEKGEMKGVEG